MTSIGILRYDGMTLVPFAYTSCRQQNIPTAVLLYSNLCINSKYHIIKIFHMSTFVCIWHIVPGQNIQVHKFTVQYNMIWHIAWYGTTSHDAAQFRKMRHTYRRNKTSHDIHDTKPITAQTWPAHNVQHTHKTHSHTHLIRLGQRLRIHRRLRMLLRLLLLLNRLLIQTHA